MTTRTCMTADCDRDARSKGMCSKHYHAAYVAANPGKVRAWNAKYYAANPARNAKYYAANPDRVRTKCTEYRANNPDAVRATVLLGRYGLTSSDYAAILSAQGGGCAGCGAALSANGRRLAVDHDHSCCPGTKSCGQCVRGLLCTKCNLTLGRMEADPSTFLRLAGYITAHCRISVNESGDVK